VLGQASKTVAVSDDGAASASTLDSPNGVWSDGTRILVADQENHRVLVWNSWPTADGQAANFVIGQSNFSGETGGGCSSINLDSPTGVSSNGTRIAISTLNQNRVLLYDSWPIADNPPAIRALGQIDLTTCGPNRGNVTNDLIGMRYPSAVFTDGTRVVVADHDSHRAMVWTSWPASSGAPANRLLGQSTAAAGGPMGTTRDSFYHYADGWGETAQIVPDSGWFGTWPVLAPSGDLWVGNTVNRKTMRYAQPVSTDNQAATWIFGQPDPGYTNAWNGNWMIDAARLRLGKN